MTLNGALWFEDIHITAYCHKRHEQRTFKFERINELEILNI